MGYANLTSSSLHDRARLQPPKLREIVRHSLLFIMTCLTVMMAGAAWSGKDFTEITTWTFGATYAFLVMSFITAHEFGHYFAARYHQINASLPYFIPVPPILMPFGTMGAFIKMKTALPSKKVLFDIGVAGPLAGFVVSFLTLLWGLHTLPGKEFLLQIHPEYALPGFTMPENSLFFGSNLLLELLKPFANPNGYFPPMNEIYHYPYLCAGWFGLFVTSLNLLPIGQLDGGHIVYAMFGRGQRVISRVVWSLLFIAGTMEFINIFREWIRYESGDALYSALRSVFLPFLDWLFMTFPVVSELWGGWLFWAFVSFVFIKLDHPPIENSEPLGVGRMVIGCLAIAIFVLSISLQGIYFR